VYWKPPPMAYNNILETASSPHSDLHLYNPADGIPSLVSALKEKLAKENLLTDVNVMVTSGANQAYMNCILTLLDENKKCVLFRPYYFNHLMAIQMTVGEKDGLVVGPCVGDSGLPDVDWLQKQLEEQEQQEQGRIHVVTVVDPCNPTGLKIPNTTIQRIVDLCRKHSVWLVMDITYEHFDHSSVSHDPGCFPCHNDPHVINIFSFSKGYSLAGFRVGYIAVSNATEESRNMYHHMLKVQDTIPICASRISQIAALGSLQQGRQWVVEKVKTLDVGREAVREALSSSLETVIGGSGAMYFMAKLPTERHHDDVEFARLLVRDYGVAVIPGSFCAAPGWIRVCYSNLEPTQCVEAAARLAEGIRNIINNT
jgi:aspartate/methionine/tyrosine aminotransferase